MEREVLDLPGQPPNSLSVPGRRLMSPSACPSTVAADQDIVEQREVGITSEVQQSLPRPTGSGTTGLGVRLSRFAVSVCSGSPTRMRAEINHGGGEPLPPTNLLEVVLRGMACATSMLEGCSGAIVDERPP